MMKMKKWQRINCPCKSVGNYKKNIFSRLECSSELGLSYPMRRPTETRSPSSTDAASTCNQRRGASGRAMIAAGRGRRSLTRTRSRQRCAGRAYRTHQVSSSDSSPGDWCFFVFGTRWECESEKIRLRACDALGHQTRSTARKRHCVALIGNLN